METTKKRATRKKNLPERALFYPKYEGVATSFKRALLESGETCTTSTRIKQIATKNGIKFYTGARRQDLVLLLLLHDGKLLR